jgi:hypothetical protein
MTRLGWNDEKLTTESLPIVVHPQESEANVKVSLSKEYDETENFFHSFLYFWRR